MFGRKKIAVVVPAHNEARLIAQAVEQIPKFVDLIIVVDDASEDGTLAALDAETARPEIVAVRHEVNQGVGAAIVTGYKKAVLFGAQIVVVMAGDAQMDPDDLPFLLDPVIKKECDYAKGDRLSWPGAFRAMPFTRYVGNHVLSKLTRLTSGFEDIRDSQCGYTAVTADLLSRIDLDSLYARYGFPNDMLAKVHAAQGRVSNVTVRPIYGQEVSGISFHTAFFSVPRVLFNSFVWRIRTERQTARRLAAAQMDIAPLNPIDG